jgi:hypothetical protein
MPGKIVPPNPQKTAFTCPSCETLCPQWRHQLYKQERRSGEVRYLETKDTWFTTCHECKASLLWHNGRIVFPATTTAPLLINGIVEDTITRQREIDEIYGALPERNLAAISKRDGK